LGRANFSNRHESDISEIIAPREPTLQDAVLDAGFFPLETATAAAWRRPRWIALAREFHFDGHIDTYYDPL
jgi:hypothetical protein